MKYLLNINVCGLLLIIQEICQEIKIRPLIICANNIVSEYIIDSSMII